MVFKRLVLIFLLGLILFSFTGCFIGILFYRDAKTTTVYKSSSSKKNYYKVYATTLSHCGCTSLAVDYYHNRKKEFRIEYMNGIVRKVIYKTGPLTTKGVSLRLIATKENNYTIPFDSLDNEIFRRIDSFAVNRPKGTYPISRVNFKGFNKEPY